MSYNEDYTDTYYYFSDDEKAKIEKLLKQMGYEWSTANVCGSCCEMYADEYWVDGIGGNFKDDDKKKMAKFCKKEGISCSIGHYTISADPTDEEEYQIHQEGAGF